MVAFASLSQAIGSREYFKFSEDGAILSVLPPRARRMEYNADGNVIYAGIANIGSATSAAVWQIQKITYSGTNPVSVTWAGGTETFTKIWDNRASLTYS